MVVARSQLVSDCFFEAINPHCNGEFQVGHGAIVPSCILGWMAVYECAMTLQ